MQKHFQLFLSKQIETFSLSFFRLNFCFGFKFSFFVFPPFYLFLFNFATANLQTQIILCCSNVLDVKKTVKYRTTKHKKIWNFFRVAALGIVYVCNYWHLGSN